MIPLFHEQVYRFARPEVEGLALGFGTAERPVREPDDPGVGRAE